MRTTSLLTTVALLTALLSALPLSLDADDDGKLTPADAKAIALDRATMLLAIRTLAVGPASER